MSTNPQPETPPLPTAEEARPVAEDWGANPVFVRSLDAFYRDLPELLKKHERKWSAYHGDECVGIARTQTELYERCLGNGLKMGEFCVMYVETAALYDRDEAYWDALDAAPLAKTYRRAYAAPLANNSADQALERVSPQQPTYQFRPALVEVARVGSFRAAPALRIAGS